MLHVFVGIWKQIEFQGKTDTEITPKPLIHWDRVKLIVILIVPTSFSHFGCIYILFYHFFNQTKPFSRPFAMVRHAFGNWENGLRKRFEYSAPGSCHIDSDIFHLEDVSFSVWHSTCTNRHTISSVYTQLYSR